MIELDGRPVTTEELAGLSLYNYGHFTSMRIDDGRVRGLSLHLQRLVHDCSVLFDADLDINAVRAFVRRVDAQGSVVVRVTVFAPDLDLGRPGRDLNPHVLVTTRPVSDQPLPPLRLRSVHYERDLPAVKHVGLFGTIRHRRLAQRDGIDDVLFVDGRSRISEGATWNIGFFDGNHLVWPRLGHLPGITMELVRSLRMLDSIDADLDLDSARAMRSAFITNAGVGVRPVGQIDRMSYGDDSIVNELAQAYLALPGDEV
jgi:branched-subunit amino acid aminotransferase/4-amino-4-deoxychorismate lyase